MQKTSYYFLRRNCFCFFLHWFELHFLTASFSAATDWGVGKYHWLHKHGKCNANLYKRKRNLHPCFTTSSVSTSHDLWGKQASSDKVLDMYLKWVSVRANIGGTWGLVCSSINQPTVQGKCVYSGVPKASVAIKVRKHHFTSIFICAGGKWRTKKTRSCISTIPLLLL